MRKTIPKPSRTGWVGVKKAWESTEPSRFECKARVRLEWWESHILRKNVKRFRGGLVFKAHRLFVFLNTRLESNKEEEVGEVIKKKK